MENFISPALPHILLVEDDEIDTEAMRRALKRANLTGKLRCARDGLEAIHILRGQEGHEKMAVPCVILLDINMPRMNGFQFLQELRGSEDHNKNIVFVVTTSDREEDKVKAYSLQAAGYFLKENLNQFVETFKQYCQTNEFLKRA